MTLIPDADTFEAARKAHFAVTLHNLADFEGMRRAGRLAAEVLDLLVPLVKPGVTGQWQVSGRNDLSVDESIRHDISYVDNWSMGLDIRIISRTVGAVVRSEGAY